MQTLQFERPHRPGKVRSAWVCLLGVAACLALALADSAALAQTTPDPSRVQIGVITFGRGDAVHQYFGHNAFLVRSSELPDTVVFNYGMFTFGPDMIPNFLKGRLRFWMGTTELRQTAAAYASHDRDVRVRALNLEPPARAAILSRLQHDARPENREYLYDHYFDNCSTRLRDVLDQALGGQLRRAWSAPARFTLREQTRIYTQHDPSTEWLMMFGLNGSVDRPQAQWDAAFLPDYFEHLLDTTSYRNAQGATVPLVASREDLYLARRPAVLPAPLVRWPFTLAIGLALGAVAWGLGLLASGTLRTGWRLGFAALALSYGVVAGTLGTLLTSLWLFSDHLVSHRNLNLLLANPLSLLAGLCALGLLRRGETAARWLAWSWGALGASTLLSLALKALSLVSQDVSLTVTLLGPINLGMSLATRRWWLTTVRPLREQTPADPTMSRSVSD